MAPANLWENLGRYTYTKSGVTTEVLLLAVGLNVQKILQAGWNKAVTSIDDTQNKEK